MYDSRCDTDGDCRPNLGCNAGACKRRAGEQCSADSDCYMGECFAGACQDPQPVGRACAQDKGCMKPARCTERVCKHPNGASCTRTSDCQSGVCENALCVGTMLDNGSGCVIDEQCVSGSCGWDDTCSAPRGEPMNCNSEPDCQAGLHCFIRDRSRDTGYCKSPGTKGNSEACQQDAECATESCTTEKVCAETVGMGKPCDSDPDCWIGLRCSISSGTLGECVL